MNLKVLLVVITLLVFLCYIMYLVPYFLTCFSWMSYLFSFKWLPAFSEFIELRQSHYEPCFVKVIIILPIKTKMQSKCNSPVTILVHRITKHTPYIVNLKLICSLYSSTYEKSRKGLILLRSKLLLHSKAIAYPPISRKDLTTDTKDLYSLAVSICLNKPWCTHTKKQCICIEVVITNWDMLYCFGRMVKHNCL